MKVPRAPLDPAVQQARAVVGLYGDPTVSWSILLELDLTDPETPEGIARRMDDVVDQRPQLGRRPDIRVFSRHEGRAPLLAEFADTPYSGRDPLLRLALSDDGRLLVVAGHHGVIDGLGLVGLAGRVLDRSLGSTARGRARQEATPGFLRGSARRLIDAAAHPATRFAGTRNAGTGDWMLHEELAPGRMSTSMLVWAASRALALHGQAGGRPVFSLGVSHRSGDAPLEPGRDTAFMRVKTARVTSSQDVYELLRRTALEPDFPATRGGGLGPVIARLLSSRLGASALLSNLGCLWGQGLAGARFWPAASGPYGVAIGLVTAGQRTGLTVRARRGWFEEAHAGAILGATAAALRSQAPLSQYGS